MQPTWVLAAGALVVVLAALVPFVRRGRANGGGTLGAGPGATVVIGDLGGADSLLALAVREALRAELVNTSGVLVTSDMGIRELKTLMRLPASASLGRPELLALATRSGAQVAITGSVVPVGAGAQIVLELIDPSTGRSIRSFAERPIDGPATLAAVDRLARSIGAAISSTPRDTSVHPLPAVTTSSLAALKSYALARRTAALGNRRDAVAPAERALAHDSLFVLAHYFLGDLLWFIDEQSHSEAHLTKAYELLATVPPHEQLVIRARYEQLVRDRPDSALAYWQLLEDASPGDAMAYEGRTWALRALGRHEEAAASADTAMMLDPGAILPNTNNALYSWLSVGDTASAIAVGRHVASRHPDALVEAHFFAALFHDPSSARLWVDSTVNAHLRHWRRHLAQVASGDVVAARAALDSVQQDDVAQFPPNALVNQGWIELVAGGGRAPAVADARAALAWTRRRDLSPPAVGRLTERIADLAARVGDETTVSAAIALVRERDHGRSLRTYVMAMRTLEAAQAYARGEYIDAAQRAESARHGVYFSRSLATIVQLEADARRAAGQTVAADSLTRLVATHQIVDGHFEAWAILRSVIARRDAQRTRASAALLQSKLLARGQEANRLLQAP
jgi:tetratricopeptide (TPR) repeat protein